MKELPLLMGEWLVLVRRKRSSNGSSFKTILVLVTFGVVYNNVIHLTFDPIMGYNLMLSHFYTMIAPVMTVVILSMHSVVVISFYSKQQTTA